MTRARDLGDFIADGAAAELVVDTTTLVVDSTNNRVGIGTASPSQALDVNGTGNFTAVTAGTITIDDITIDGSTISDGGDFTLDVGGDIILDADGGDVKISDGGTHVGSLRNVSSDFVIQSIISDQNIIFKGNDGGTEFNALSLDMSENGLANFAAGAIFEGDISVTAATNAKLTINDQIGEVGSGNLALQAQNTSGSSLKPMGFRAEDIRFATGASERFRIGTSGQLGIGGATYGTSGQVLTSGGSGAAPTWADAGGGGSIELTASEGISAGTVVTLKSNGQSQLIGYASDATNVSTETKTSTSTSINFPAAAYDPDTQKVGVVYADGAARAQAAIFSPSGFGGSFGSATQILNDQDAQQHRMMYDTTYNQFVGIHRMTSDNTGKYFVLSTNGSTMTVDAGNANFEGSEVTHLSMDIDQTNARVFVAYRHSDNSSRGTVIAGTLSDGNVSWGSGHVFQSSGDSESPFVAWNSTSNVLLVAFKSGLANDLRVYAATVSGTTFTDRNNYSHNQNVSQCMAVADPVNSTAGSAMFHVAFYGGNGIQIFRQSFDTSSWSGSSSSIQVLSTSDPSSFSSQYAGTASLTRDALTGRLYLFTKESSAFFEIEYNAVTDSYSFEKNTGASSWMVNAEQITRLGTTQDTNTGTIYNVIRDGSNNLGMQTSSVSNVNAFLGVSESTVTSGNTHKVTVISGVNEAVSGLTPGSIYYLTSTGALTTTNTGIKIGKALAANKLYIDSTGA